MHVTLQHLYRSFGWRRCARALGSMLSPTLVVVTANLAPFPASAGDVSPPVFGNSICSIEITGTIRAGDPAKLASSLQALSARRARTCSSLYIYLDSLGGDVAASLAMGRLVRTKEATVVVERNARCASACVFILAGAAYRLPLGRIFIHRPYSTSTGSRPIDEIRAERKALQSEIRQYLEEVDVPLALLDAMDSIPPELSRELGDSELDLYRLSGVDPTIQERDDALYAKHLGLTREEYVGRRAECEARIRDRDAYKQCRHNLRHALPAPEYW